MKNPKKKVDYRSRLTKDQIWTIPNILSFVRLALIPLIIWLYIGEKQPVLALAVILLSGLTDIVDGFIARHFNMITDFGKMLDPVADKLTQIAILISLVSRFPLMLLPLCIMVVKEIVSFVIRLCVFRKTEEVHSAVWHGKANTVILYAIICLHIIWIEIPPIVSTLTILFSAVFMVFSFVLYMISCLRVLTKSKQSEALPCETVSEEK